MKTEKEEGFGSGKNLNAIRFFDKDGNYNIERKGSLNGIRDIYKYFISINWFIFILIVAIYFVAINLIFSTIYLSIGLDGIQGIDTKISDFWNAFFFSVQTFTTIGYGALHPVSFDVHILVVVQSFISIISIAFVTGLLYGRFSKPSSKILFSDMILFTNHNEKKAIMFKLVNARKSVLLNAKVKVIMMMDHQSKSSSNAIKANHSLKLELDTITFFPLTWTIVHSIDENSPLLGMDFNQIIERNAEVIVLVEAFDETHSQSIFKVKSYAGEQWVNNRKFARSFNSDGNGKIVLDINSINELI